MQLLSKPRIIRIATWIGYMDILPSCIQQSCTTTAQEDDGWENSTSWEIIHFTEQIPIQRSHSTILSDTGTTLSSTASSDRYTAGSWIRNGLIMVCSVGVFISITYFFCPLLSKSTAITNTAKTPDQHIFWRIAPYNESVDTIGKRFQAAMDSYTAIDTNTTIGPTGYSTPFIPSTTGNFLTNAFKKRYPTKKTDSTPPYYAAQIGSLNTLKQAIERHANQLTKPMLKQWLNTQDQYGCTVLDYAIQCNHPRTANWLRIRGATSGCNSSKTGLTKRKTSKTYTGWAQDLCQQAIRYSNKAFVLMRSIMYPHKPTPPTAG